MFIGNSEAQRKEFAATSADRTMPPGEIPTIGKYSESGAHPTLLLTQKSGVGIHTGKEVAVRVELNGLDGIHFSFLENETLFSCPAQWDRLSGTTRTTALVMRGQSRKRVQVAMIEHFMAAAHIWMLNRVDVKLALKNTPDAETVEVPILDGSSLEWCTSLKANQRPASEQAVWVVTKRFEHSDGDRTICLDVDDSPRTSYFFEGKFGNIYQKNSFAMNWLAPADSQQDFLKRIAPARTFGFLHEVQALRARGLALGGSLDNALVIDGDGFVNPEGERIENELASHKLLDAVGDFALAAKPILGKISLRSAGHALHLRTLQLAFESGSLQPGFLMADGRIIVGCANSPS